MRAYHLEIPEHDLALLIVDDGEQLQVLSGSPESISHLAASDSVSGVVVSVVRSWEDGHKRWFRKESGSRLSFNEGALSYPHTWSNPPGIQGANLKRVSNGAN